MLTDSFVEINELFPRVVSDILRPSFGYFYSFFGNFTDVFKFISLLDTDYFFCIIVPSIDLFSFMGSTFPMLGSIFEVRTFNFLEGRFWPLFFTVVGNPKISSSYSSSIIPLGWSYLCELIFFRELRASNCLVSSSISQIFVSLAAGYFRFWTFFLNSLYVAEELTFFMNK